MVADGIREDKATAGQRHTAAGEKTPPEAAMLMEQVVGRENLREALGRVECNKGAHTAGVAERRVQTPARAEGRYPKAWRGGYTNARHPDSAGQVHTTSRPAGIDSHLRPNVLGRRLRFSSWQVMS